MSMAYWHKRIRSLTTRKCITYVDVKTSARGSAKITDPENEHSASTERFDNAEAQIKLWRKIKPGGGRKQIKS